ncbi:MAG: hypothetical protein ACYS76_15730 [Planctomycetota bacterium]|jgi:hypothetical protein
MIDMDANHCRIVGESLKGERAVDEQTFASVAILSERLERLRKMDQVFEEVRFSPAVKKLLSRHRGVVAVG